jgi:UPF0755 protein
MSPRRQAAWPDGSGPQQMPYAAAPGQVPFGGPGPQRQTPHPGGGWRGRGPEDDDEGFLPYDDEGDADRPRKRRRFRWMAPLVAALVIVLPLGAAGYFGLKFYMDKYHPADYAGPGTGTITVDVPSGATATSLAPQLQSDGVVASSRAFVLAAEHYTGGGTLESGYFQLRHHMQASQAYAILVNPKNMMLDSLVFPEGLRVSSVISLLGKESARTKLPLSAYQAAIKDVAALRLPSYANGKVEGYLFPATYDVTPNETALQVLQAMVAKFNTEAAALNLASAASKVGLTPGKVIIVASLLQAEGGKVSDYPKIARVVYNRLRDGMKLQFDSTVLYGLNRFGTTVTEAEINDNTPYNSYLHTGLPPTPIDNPGVAAIQAALNPASGNYLYFFTEKNGTTEFSATPIAG